MFSSYEKKMKYQNKKPKGKKGQMAGQILIYVLAIIVFSLTLVYGYKAIKGFADTGEEILYLQLENDIKTEVEKVQGDTMGTLKKKILQIPGNYKQVCFVESYTSPDNNDVNTGYAIIDNAFSEEIHDKNMFLVPPGNVGFDIGVITVEGYSECINIVGGKVTLRVESMGDHVKISGW
jgi:hypothetical protein